VRQILLVVLLWPLSVLAGCPQFYPLGIPVAVPHSVELCNSFYVVEFDTQLNGAILSAEKFQRGSHPERSNDFHTDTRLPVSTRAENSDYAHMGYDKGHLTPAADAVNATEMHDTFLLSNMTPQEPSLNRKAWRELEIQVRQLKPDYVVTGAVYPALKKRIGAHGVPVPSGYYKIIWMRGVINAWYADNKPNADILATSVSEVERMTGLKFPRYGGIQ